ncbi:SDR family oxidoreductase [Aspergillus undulatus]|uniref:SDR family oxidoreductase n=1 Tax=Aspergillus undulatus TaxID=1810928 RepID=UPI003CCDC3B7
MVLHQPQNQHVTKAFNLSGKVAVVTGGARGIGLEVSRGLAEAGADIAIIYNTSSTANTTASEIAATNKIRARAYQANVSDKPAIESAINQIKTDFGRIDIVIINSGIASSVPAEEYTVGEWRSIMDVNLDGAFYTAQAAAKAFKEQKMTKGNIVFTASVSAGLVNVPQKQAAYNASKAAVVQLAKCLSVEWVDICRVNCISPGFIATEILDHHPKEWREKWFDMIPAKRMAQTYELKGAYVFAASDASSYMTGADITIDGGYTLP